MVRRPLDATSLRALWIEPGDAKPKMTGLLALWRTHRRLVKARRPCWSPVFAAGASTRGQEGPNMQMPSIPPDEPQMGAAERELHTLDWSPLTHLAAAQEAIKLGLLHRAQEHIALAAEKWIGEHL